MENNKLIMKQNVYLIQTDKESDLYFNNNTKSFQVSEKHKVTTNLKPNFNVFITNNEKPKHLDFVLNEKNNSIFRYDLAFKDYYLEEKLILKKIVITNDSELISLGVQKIIKDRLKQLIESSSTYVSVNSFKPPMDLVDVNSSKCNKCQTLINHDLLHEHFFCTKCVIYYFAIPNAVENISKQMEFMPYERLAKKLYETLVREKGHSNAIVDIKLWLNKPNTKNKELYERVLKMLENKENDLDCPFEFTSRCTMGRCDCKPKILTGISTLDKLSEKGIPKGKLTGLYGYNNNFISFDGTDQLNFKFDKNIKDNVYSKAENFVKNHPDFETEGFSEYQNGVFNGFIEGFNSNKSCGKAIADIRNKMGYVSNLLSLLKIEEKDEYVEERIKELIHKSVESIEWLRNIKIEDYEN